MEKHDYKKILKSLKIDKDCYNKKFTKINQKQSLYNIFRKFSRL